ncbi:NADP-dependent oxidoreductase [Pseudomonas oryzihabitans]|uniref:NADP-dependent oxidoreductase n=1 Tax=Pseudomonas oryzihabitans TaxID=47885 RepID=UPI002893E3F0|nr:NADP-dependent oxidoreductase [Pseudomonas oryzihabitans]MDT3722249.1 NADP-dependent oxidoreductase [Pseudomonas oryzihabitans]
MKAFIIDRYGKQILGRLGDIPSPEMKPDDVLIQIHATSINPLDIKIGRGEFKFILPYTLPLVLGSDVAGTVVAVGSEVHHFKPGDEVYARPDHDRIGSFAEFIAIKSSSIALKPTTISMVEAGTLPLVALTAWQALVETAKIKRGQKILIHAGSGGVGSIAIQLAKYLGAFVATTTSSSNVEWVRALGADVVIDYRQQDFVESLRDYDVVLTSLGAIELKKSLGIIKPGGHLVSISGPPTPQFADDQKLAWPLKQIMRLLSRGIRKQAQARGVTYTFVFMRADGNQLAKLATLIDQGAIRPVVDRVYSLAEAAEALAYLGSGRAKGKVGMRIAVPG